MLFELAPRPLHDFISRVNLAVSGLVTGVRCTSWYRDAEHNRRVNGAEFSQHLVGLAADLQPTFPVTLGDLAAALEAQGLTVIVYAAHVHAQLFPGARFRDFVQRSGG